MPFNINFVWLSLLKNSFWSFLFSTEKLHQSHLCPVPNSWNFWKLSHLLQNLPKQARNLILIPIGVRPHSLVLRSSLVAFLSLGQPYGRLALYRRQVHILDHAYIPSHPAHLHQSISLLSIWFKFTLSYAALYMNFSFRVLPGPFPSS